jgi:serine/threonine protein kinase
MAAGNILYTCDDLNQDIKPSDVDVFDSITIIEYIGQGAYGAAFKILIDDQVLVMKAMKHYYYPMAKSKLRRQSSHIVNLPDIKMACLIKDLHSYTPCLSSIIGFALFDEDTLYKVVTMVSEQDSEDEDVMIGGNTLAIIVMPLYYDIGNSLYFRQWRSRSENIPYPTDAVRLDIMFELLVAIHTLNSHGIIHGDLRPENILFAIVDNKRQYTINDIIYIVESKYMPIIIERNIPGHYPGGRAVQQISLIFAAAHMVQQ